MITPNNTPHVEADYVIFTGRLKAGKDYVAEHSGHTVYGFADPMYTLAEHFIGSSDKDDPGVRRFLQKVGAWGRGEVSEDYPLTPERQRITEEIRSRGAQITGIDLDADVFWSGFGLKEDFWVQVLDSRIQKAEEDRIAITNGRFPNELNHFLQESGKPFVHRHVMCSEETRKERLEADGEEYDPDAETDVTEQLAHELDELAVGEAILNKLIGVGGDYPMLNDLHYGVLEDIEQLTSVVWNDDPEKMPEGLENRYEEETAADSESSGITVYTPDTSAGITVQGSPGFTTQSGCSEEI